MDTIPFLDIDFEGQNHAFMYVPLLNVSQTINGPKETAKENREWFPFDVSDEHFNLVGKFNLISWKYEEGMWLVKKKPRKVPKINKIDLDNPVGAPSMLDFMFSGKAK